VSGGLAAQALQVGTLRIDSVPSAAAVELIGGNAGTTPLTISERDIYPNNYPDARADLYGTVTLRHPGCAPLRHRVTLDDLKQDLHLRLDCARDNANTLAARPVVASKPPAPVPASAAMPSTPPETLPERRLRQLQVLQELLDEGLLNPAEELRLRRKLLQSSPRAGI
jgi:hypothetical protein